MARAVIESTPEDESAPEYKGGSSRTRGAAQDVESEEEMDVDAEGDEDDAEGELDEEQNEEDATYDVSDAAEDTPPPTQSRKGKQPAARSSGLKITLKPPAPQPQKSPRTRRNTRIIESPPEGSEPPSREIESEDEDAEGEEDEDDDDEVMPGASGRQLTARQAAMASVEETSHVSLEAAPGRKKKQLNEVEEALKREETARKRKHMSEKRLEDEKMDTINRLLKKQSRPRNKRNALATADDRTPVSQTNAGTPDVEEEGSVSLPPRPVEVPTMYRWISTSRPATLPIPEAGIPVAVIPASAVDEPPAHPAVAEPVMVLSFSVPVNALAAAVSASKNAAPSESNMDVDAPSRKMTPHCVAPGCQMASKYRLKSNFTQGVCGIEHLKLLEQSIKA